MGSRLIFVGLLALLNFAAIRGTTEFIAKATPGFLQIEGKGGILDTSKAIISANQISGSFTTKLSDLKTGISERDGHMLGYLEAEKFPTATLKLKEPVLMGGGTIKKFRGDFTLHGVTNQVEGTVEFSSTKAEARFTIDVTQYGIKVPTYKLLTVGKSVEILVTLEL